MAIKILPRVTKFIFLITLILLVIGLLLPQQYQIQKSITIHAPQSNITPLLSDFTKWPSWSPWQKVDPSIVFTLGEPSAGVGAHQFWQSSWGFGEMTITNISGAKINFNILFNEEHIVTGEVSFSPQASGSLVTCTLFGEVTTPILGGYLALFSQYILQNTLTLGLNNLKTAAQLQTIPQSEKVDDDSNSPSKN
ncbi:SRPBCC family protein [Pseudoalteromonas prydzensis]|uniref:SRPBCC family protein n=1 Tax=Pseudoalteromonas prydzensis TaxID=182141 RepID=A0ABR9FPL8_9GAMM|nr:SRPBCC family protein [Pseudoalteromonas prydzensis]MBE0458782.1 SRPBCC family protein [Pseudoalteromonas prydzensis]